MSLGGFGHPGSEPGDVGADRGDSGFGGGDSGFGRGGGGFSRGGGGFSRGDAELGAFDSAIGIPGTSMTTDDPSVYAAIVSGIQREADREAARQASVLAHQRSLELDRQAEELAKEAAVANAAVVAPPVNKRGIQSFLGPLGLKVFYGEEGKIDPVMTGILNVPVLGNLMKGIDYVGGKNWSTESPFAPYDIEQFSSTPMRDFSFPGDLPRGGFDPTHGEGGDPYSNFPSVAPPAPEPEPEMPPAPEAPTYDPSLWYRPTLLDQPSGIPNFAALNDAFTRSYALRPGIYTDQPNLLGYTPYG